MKTVKVSLNVPEDLLAKVRELKKRRGTSTMTAVFLHAISDAKFFSDAVKNGGKIIIEDKRGKMHEVVYR